jgi:putative spermidine/putrescine transport system substrate-binding protein
LAAVKAPYVFAKSRPKLRVLGTHVTLQEEIRLQAEKDLGLEIVFEPGGSSAVLQKAVHSAQSFDLYEQWSDSINFLWQAGTIQPIEKNRLKYWDEISSLVKTGRLTPDAALGAGDAPYKLLHVDTHGGLTRDHTTKLSFLPYVHNVDSFGYNTLQVDAGVPYETESWGWLLDDRYRGRVGIVNSPSIGVFDLALAAQSVGLVKFNDIGAITKPELDKLFGALLDYRRNGHFAGFWNSVPESVDYMARGRVVIESMFSPAVSSLNSSGIPVTYAAPKEGYRGWHGVMCLSAAAKGFVKDAAYEYMNWWLSGWAGAFIARKGYYISNPERSRPWLTEAEWGYWYEGLPASEDLVGADGRVAVQQGQIRTGGSYWKRFSNVAVWNTVMPEYDYSLQKWYEFISG